MDPHVNEGVAAVAEPLDHHGVHHAARIMDGMDQIVVGDVTGAGVDAPLARGRVPPHAARECILIIKAPR
ncbi:MAG: hypothetical protein EAX95_10080 [Candidatus Thorarchaeota archaeon]|nr:hypothetical protein [Candidatus Thorarchaeota archaeon]